MYQGRWLINLFTKYWIFLSCGMLLLVSIQNTVVIYRIIYMAFYLFFILSFQVCLILLQLTENINYHCLDFIWILEKNSSYISFGNYYLFNDSFNWIIYLSSRERFRFYLIDFKLFNLLVWKSQYIFVNKTKQRIVSGFLVVRLNNLMFNAVCF